MDVGVVASHNPALPVSTLRAILLLLAALPAMLMPAGIGVDRCGCTGALRFAVAGREPACWQEQRANAEAAHSCCRRATEASVASGDHGCGALAAADGCGCEVSAVPQTPPKHPVPPTVGDPPLALLGAVAAPAVIAVRFGFVRTVTSARGPPAPGEQRNLPLLL